MDVWSLLSRLRPVALHLGVVFLLLGVAVTGATGYTHLSDPMEEVTERQEVPTVSATTTYTTAATVTGESDLYEEGTRLRNRSTYVVGASPEVSVAVGTRFDQRVSAVEQRLTLETRALRGEDVFWTDRTPLDGAALESGASIETAGTLNASALADRRERLRSELGGRSDIQMALVARVAFEDPVTGERRTRVRRIPIELAGGSLFSLGAEEPTPTRTFATTRTVTTERVGPVPWLRYGVGIALSGLGAAFLWLRNRDAVFGTSIERTPVGEWERTLRRYSEWISAGSLVNHESEESIPIDDVPELVKMSMNNRGGLVHCDTTDIVAYLDGDVTYYCRGPDSSWDPQDTLASAFGFEAEVPNDEGFQRQSAELSESVTVSTTDDAEDFSFGFDFEEEDGGEGSA